MESVLFARTCDEPSVVSLRTWVRQRICALTGHDRLLYRTTHRMTLRCVACEHETSGWTLDAVPPSIRFGSKLRA